MDTVRKKVEKATRVGKSLVKSLIPHGELYTQRVTEAITKDRTLALTITAFRVPDPDGHWKLVDKHLLSACNNLSVGCLYSAMQISVLHLGEELDLKIQKYLELEFFNAVDEMESRNGHAAER